MPQSSSVLDIRRCYKLKIPRSWSLINPWAGSVVLNQVYYWVCYRENNTGTYLLRYRAFMHLGILCSQVGTWVNLNLTYLVKQLIDGRFDDLWELPSSVAMIMKAGRRQARKNTWLIMTVSRVLPGFCTTDAPDSFYHPIAVLTFTQGWWSSKAWSFEWEVIECRIFVNTRWCCSMLFEQFPACAIGCRCNYRLYSWETGDKLTRSCLISEEPNTIVSLPTRILVLSDPICSPVMRLERIPRGHNVGIFCGLGIYIC